MQALKQLQYRLKTNNLQAYIIHHVDSHQSEYPPEYWKIVAFLTGFTGSNAILVITPEKLALWTDGRYTLQAKEQLKDTPIQAYTLGTSPYPDYKQWLLDHIKNNQIIAIDFNLISATQYQQLQNTLAPKKIALQNKDLITPLWKNRPSLPCSQVYEYLPQYAGNTRMEKLNLIKTELKQQKITHHIITTLDDIAWILNIRANDIEYTPVAIAYLLISHQQTILYIDSSKHPQTLINSEIVIKDYNQIYNDLQQLTPQDTISLDLNKINQNLYSYIPKHTKTLHQPNPSTILKASKNLTEIKNAKQAHVKDGVAMVKTLCWLYNTIGKKNITELTIAEKLYHYRSQQKDFVSESFPSIVGYRQHGAIVHYQATSKSNQAIHPKELLLIDSGGHYLQGTTDITRTVTLGNPTPQQITDFTLVLKGHIALATAIFLSDTTGQQLDLLAREPLLQHNLNYLHGTGHGVGCFLSVHEGPHSISYKGKHPIPIHSITSNEPGIYREGQYGIRTENLLLCIKKEQNQFGNFYQFETLTLCPIDLQLIDKSLLTVQEIQWLNNYHQIVYKKLSSHLETVEKQWLKDNTRKL